MATDWTVTVADRIDNTVKLASDRVATVTTVARAIVYGLLAAFVGTMALVLLAIALVRVLDAYLPQEVWLPYLIVGAIFTLGGLFLWSKRRPKKDAGGS